MWCNQPSFLGGSFQSLRPAPPHTKQSLKVKDTPETINEKLLVFFLDTLLPNSASSTERDHTECKLKSGVSVAPVHSLQSRLFMSLGTAVCVSQQGKDYYQLQGQTGTVV